MEFKDIQEQKRTYHFSDGKLVIENVVKFAMPGSTHRLETADGRKFIVKNNWQAIELDVPEWSF
jgi:hypothetical protein